MKYSVIVPVYNVEAYLPKCVDSILACKNSDFELLLIDDGSTDNSGKICDDYVQKDSRVKAFHKKNGGVSSARNLGLDNACGDWIMFVDSDDWVADSFFDVPDSEADIIERPYSRIDMEGKILGSYKPSPSRIIKDKWHLFDFFVNERINVLWNKVIKRSLIGKARFNESVSIGEDFLLYLEIIKRVNRYEFSDKGEYFYLHRAGSAMSNIANERRIGILFENMEHIKSILDSSEYDELKNGIFCVSYFPLLCDYQKSMAGSVIADMKKVISEMASGSFRYVPFMMRIKVLIKNFTLHL